MKPKYSIHVGNGELFISKNQSYYKRIRDDLDVVSQEIELTALDLLILNLIKNYKSCDDIYRELFRKFGKADYKTIQKKLNRFVMKKVVKLY